MKIELSLQPELDPEGCGGAENHHFFDVFLEPHFGMAFGAHFGDFGSLWGSLLETILLTFWVPFLDRFSEDFQDSPKVKVGLEWVVIWGVTGVQKQVYINKISRSTDGNQLTYRQQIS